jgi:two-component system, NtrC family, sensor kinase
VPAMRIDERLTRQLLKLDLQTRLVVGFLIAVCLTGLIATLIGVWTINKNTLDEVQSRVRQDINTAKLIYNYTLERMVSLIQYAAEGSDLYEAIAHRKLQRMEGLKGLIRRAMVTQTSEDHLYLDMLSVVDTEGKVLYSATNPAIKGDSMLWDPVVRRCLETQKPQSSTELMPLERIVRENPFLADRVAVEIVKTPKSFDLDQKRLSEGMVMRAAYPIMDKGQKQLGVLVGGLLLTRDRSIVDKVKETISRDEKYRGREVGVATIFQGGVRISTNVMTSQNTRAVGTTLSKEVYERVIQQGKDWVGRAFVVNDWYITTYTPIYNLEHKLIGILYTGILEAKYRDIKWRLIWINMGITILGMIIAFVISLKMGNTIINRIRILKKATEAIASGNLDYRLSPDRISGFDILDEAFNDMSKSLKDRDERLQKAHEQLTRSDKLTALGEMAAGVAHEINNPLGGILLYGNLVLEDLPEGGSARENMQKIIQQTIRCKNIVQGLLDFARTPTGDMVPLQLNDIVRTALDLVKEQSLFHGIEIETRLAPDLPEVIGDPSRLEEVFLNLFINAADAMKEKGGKLMITTAAGSNRVRVVITDTGKGIDREHLPHIFEPFFTTKAPGLGTGLGLSIAYGVIKKHNGFIDAESVPGRGTTFIVSLPSPQEPWAEAERFAGQTEGKADL